MVKEIQLRINLVEELKEDILLQKASKQLEVYLQIKIYIIYFSDF